MPNWIVFFAVAMLCVSRTPDSTVHSALQRLAIQDLHDAVLCQRHVVCVQPACENLEEVGIMMAVSVAKAEATCKADVKAPRQYHALWIRVEAVARTRVRYLMASATC